MTETDAPYVPSPYRFYIEHCRRIIQNRVPDAIRHMHQHEMIIRVRRRPKQGRWWRAIDQADLNAKAIGGQGRLKRLIAGTASSHTRAMYKSDGYRAQRLERIELDGGSNMECDDGAELHCVFCKQGVHGNDEHMHQACSAPELVAVREAERERMEHIAQITNASHEAVYKATAAAVALVTSMPWPRQMA